MLNQNQLLTTIFSFILSLAGFSQQRPSFSKDAEFEKKTLNAITTRHQQNINGLKGPNKKYFADIYQERFNLVKEKFSKGEVVSDKKAQDYLNTMAAKVFKANTILDAKQFHILFSRYFVPNAFSMGEGIIFFNAGLFHQLENESQAAFVLCHEIAHDYLDHSNQSIAKYVNTVYSDEFQKDLKKIYKSEYSRNSQVEKLSQGLMYKSRSHSREFEQSADSLAVELMKNSGFDVREAITCLGLLDSVDHNKYKTDFELEKVFNFSEYPFKKRWLDDDAIKFVTPTGADDKKQEDSLKTHPDCSIRIERIKEKVAHYFAGNSKKFLVDEIQFNALKSAFDFDVINYMMETRQISKALFLALEMLPVFPGDTRLHAVIGTCLNEIYYNQKGHTLGTVVDLPGPGTNLAYNNVLLFIQNLRLAEVAALSYYFLMQHQTKSITNEDFVAALIESKAHFDKPGEKQQWINFYKSNFPKGKHQF